jgi:spore coat protein H
MTRYWLFFLVSLLATPKQLGTRPLQPETQDIASRCTNHYDDDGDFLVDCEERECWANPACQPSRCDEPGQCRLIECLYAPLCYEAQCQDRQDNDGDGLGDCLDPDCDTFFGCEIERCDNQEDDDQNGATDCEDPQCKGRNDCIIAECRGVCLGDERCDDHRDNDQDGLFDCRDPDCFGVKSCGGLREAGASCSQAGQCTSGGCLSEAASGYPNGLCTQVCQEARDCPNSSLCTAGLCLSTCETSGNCREGYSCFEIPSGFACLPDCGGSWDCPDTGACNLYSGYCTAELGAKRDQASCSSDEECESTHCIDGFCTSLCAGDRESCPADYYCKVALGVSDAGLCIEDLQPSGFIEPWEQPTLLESLLAAQQLSASMVRPEEIEDEASPLFSLQFVHKIEITLSPEERARVSLGERAWARASFSFDGQVLDEVGLRLKGSDGSGQELSAKAAFSIKFDAFTNGLSLYGLQKLLLNNSWQDPSFLSEVLGYWLYQRYGIPAPRAAYAEVSVNGEPYGLYVIVEPKDKRFVKSRFGESGPLYEGSYGADFDRPEDLEEHIGGGTSQLQNLQQFLASTPDTELGHLPEYLDLDQFMLAWALDAIFDNWDGYFFQANNFYLFQEPNQRFVLLPHGADQFFGTRDTRLDTFPVGEIGKRLARSQKIKERFEQEAQRILNDTSLEDDIRVKIDALLSLIDTAAKRDPKKPHSEEERRLFSLWIREFMAARREYLEVNANP